MEFSINGQSLMATDVQATFKVPIVLQEGGQLIEIKTEDDEKTISLANWKLQVE